MAECGAFLTHRAEAFYFHEKFHDVLAYSGQENKTQGNSDQGIGNSGQLSSRGYRSTVSITWPNVKHLFLKYQV